jgi:DNA repair exonuclease SbcCD ATPase subunit
MAVPPARDSQPSSLSRQIAVKELDLLSCDVPDPIAEISPSVRIAELEAELARLAREHDRLVWIDDHRRRDLMLKDAFLSELRLELQERQFELSACHEQLRSRDAEVSALNRHLAAVHEGIASTLRQPRYRLVDRINATLRRTPHVHRLLKSILPGH